MMRHMVFTPPGILAAAVALMLTGCLAPGIRCPHDESAKRPNPDPEQFAPFTHEPKARIGSVPCTGTYTLFKLGDPNKLGAHQYHSGFGNEAYKGIIYTRHGGFIDIAHLRKAADWTAYHHSRIRYALNEGWSCIVLRSKEPSVYHIAFNYPPTWNSLPEAKRKAMIDEVSIRLAQRLAITQTSWHEIITWFGYTSTPLPEKASAFTYDDTTSHILGAQVAGMALREKTSDYDRAVTRHLSRELHRLGAVSPDQTLAAISAVEGDWWRDGRVIKRQLDIGEDDGVVTAWVVPGFPGGPNPVGEAFRIPSLDNTLGYDLRGFAGVEIDPRIWQWSKMRRLLPGRPKRVSPDRDFPIYMDYIRAEEGHPRQASGR